jgi:hypothetical protein
LKSLMTAMSRWCRLGTSMTPKHIASMTQWTSVSMYHAMWRSTRRQAGTLEWRGTMGRWHSADRAYMHGAWKLTRLERGERDCGKAMANRSMPISVYIEALG